MKTVYLKTAGIAALTVVATSALAQTAPAADVSLTTTVQDAAKLLSDFGITVSTAGILHTLLIAYLASKALLKYGPPQMTGGVFGTLLSHIALDLSSLANKPADAPTPAPPAAKAP